jgi:hypothetical protein
VQEKQVQEQVLLVLVQVLVLHRLLKEQFQYHFEYWLELFHIVRLSLRMLIVLFLQRQLIERHHSILYTTIPLTVLVLVLVQALVLAQAQE